MGQYLNQELALDRAGVVDRHISGCSRCQDFLDLLVRRGSPRESLREIGPDLKGDNAEAAAAPSVPGFELAELIGTGGMGRVWKARQLDAGGRVVAVKTLFGGAHADPEWVARFDTEIKALAKLSHPNIVKLYTSGPTPHGFYYAMEYLPAGSLADARRQNPDAWTARRAAELIAAAARGIDHAHQHGLIHRDLKPANILIAGDGAPKVADFGLARSIEGAGEYSRTGRVLGTPVYMAPEQAAGTKQLSPATDVYGLGGVLYYLLTGLPPIPDDGSELDVLTRVRHDDPVTPRQVRPTLPKDLETICLKCLRKDAGQRYETADALAEDLDRFLSGRPILARPVSLAARAGKWVRRNPIPTAALVFLTLAAGAAAVAWQAEARAGRAERDASEAVIKQFQAEQSKVAERSMRLQAVQERVNVERQTALLAALRGPDRAKALAQLATDEKDGVPITPEIRFAEVDALEATGAAGKARERLEGVGPGFPSELAARRDLRLGDLLLGIDDARARTLIEAAREGPGLSEADREYGRGVFAPTILEALPHLRKAAESEPAHLPSRRALCLFLLCSGQLAEATRAAEDGALLYPDHPDLRWVLMLAHGLAGDAERARKSLDRLKPSLLQELYGPFDELATFLPLLTREFQAGVRGEPPAADVKALRLRIAQQKPAVRALLGFEADGPANAAELFLRLPPACGDSLREIWRLIHGTAGGADPFAAIARDDAATAKLAATVKANPDGFLRFAYGMVLFTRALGYQQANPDLARHGDAFRERMAAAGAAFESASTSHGLIGSRQVALEKAVFCYTLAGKPGWAKEAKPEWVAKSRDLLQRRLRMPDLVHPADFVVFVKSARNAGDVFGDYTAARAVLVDWECRAPDDLGATRLRAEVEFLAGAYLPALHAVEEVLAKVPDDADMKALGERCRQRLRVDVAPPPRLVK